MASGHGARKLLHVPSPALSQFPDGTGPVAVRLRDLPEGWKVAVDTESSGLYVDDGARLSVVSFAFRDPETDELLAQAVAFDQGVNELPCGPKDLPKRHLNRMKKWPEWAQAEVAPNLDPDHFVELVEILREFRLIYHNAKHDQHMIRAGLRVHDNCFPEIFDLSGSFYWDTQIGQHVIDPRYPTGLKPTGVRLELTGGGEDAEAEALAPWKGPKTDPRYDLIPWKILEEYASRDAALTLLLEEYQQARLVEEPYLRNLLEVDFENMQVLYKMERRGVPFDAKLSGEMADLLAFKRAEVASSLPFRATPPGAKKYFFGPRADCSWCEGQEVNCPSCTRPPYKGKRTPTGLPKLDEEVQEWLVRDGVEWAPEYRFHEQLKSAESKWYRPWAERCGPDGRLRATFRNTTVVTGRLSAERANLLAIPHLSQMPDVPGLVPVRALFRPDPGFELWEIDVAQADVRVGASEAECRSLLEGFRAGIDAHTRAAQEIFQLDRDEVAKHPELRQVAKTLNLALQYWAGIDKIRDALEAATGKRWPRAQVKKFRDGWHDAFPELLDGMERAKFRAETVGYVQLWNGRVRWFSHERAGPPEPPFTAFNGLVQGGVAEVMKRVMNRWERLYPGTLLLQTHDSLLLELPEGTAQGDAEWCAEIMVEEFELAMTKTWRNGETVRFPFEADVKRFG